MSRVIVSIMSDQTIQNYIFIKENFQIGDELLFISSHKMQNKIEWITNTLQYVNCNISSIILDVNEEERWFKMSNKIRESLTEGNKYIVNITGGTKYMSMAVLRVFEDFDSNFYYIPFPKNEILLFKKDHPEKLNYAVTIEEYLSLFNVLQDPKHNTLIKKEDYTKSFFNLFISGELTQNEFAIIDKLRAYRDRGIQDISLLEETISTNEKKPQIIDLSNFLKTICFDTDEPNKLKPVEIQYLTGGWFEEYIYNKVVSDVHPTDIALGLQIKKLKNPFLNDLDIVFTLGNKLFVIECKTGISSVKMLNDTIYKAAALKETLFGLPGNTFIFSLGGIVENFEFTAKNMGITYFDRSTFIDELKWKKLVETIKNIAKV